MNHKAFVSRTAAAIQLTSDGRPNDAVAALRELLRDLAPHVKDGVNEWHQQQTLGLLVEALDAAGEDDECRAAWAELVHFTEGAATYWDHARSSARADYDRWRTEHPA